MSETVDDVRPLATGELDPIAVAKVVRKVLVILTPPIVALVAAVWGAIHSVAAGAEARAQQAKQEAQREAQAQVQLVKDKAEGGYAYQRELERRVAELERLARQAPRARGTAARHPPPPAPPPPANLDEAYRKVYRKPPAPAAAPPPVEPAKDAGP